MPNELNNSYDLLGSAVALVASIGRLREPHTSHAHRKPPPSSCTNRGDASDVTTPCLVFDPGKPPRFSWSSSRIGCIARGGGILFPVCAIVNSEPSVPELPCPWLGEWVRLVPFQSGSNIFPSVYPLRVRQCKACSMYFQPTKVALPPHALQVL
jgi:hypothetical protein